MKNKLIIFILTIFAFSSCKKIINVDLKNAEPRLVIEGIVDDSGNPASVKISKTSVFSADNNYPKVSNAVVKITDNLGNAFTLTETSTGNYTNATLVGVIGRTYNLSVTAEGKIYTASSTIPRKMALDTLVIETNTIGNGPPGSAATKNVAAIYEDLVGYGDNVQIVQTINGKSSKQINVDDDRFTDGGSSPFSLFTGDIKLKTGDLVKVELRFIDKNVFKYFSGILELNGGNSIPENPKSNISGNVLGVFSAHTSETKTIIIP